MPASEAISGSALSAQGEGCGPRWTINQGTEKVTDVLAVGPLPAQGAPCAP